MARAQIKPTPYLYINVQTWMCYTFWCDADTYFIEPYKFVSLCVARMLHPMNFLMLHLYTIDTLNNNNNNNNTY